MRDETYIHRADWNTNAGFKHNFPAADSLEKSGQDRKMFSNLSPKALASCVKESKTK